MLVILCSFQSSPQVQEVSITKSGDALLGVVNPKYTFVKHGVTVGFTADTDKNTKFEVSVEDPIPGLKLTTIVCTHAMFCPFSCSPAI